MIYLSDHFTLEEATFSEVASRKNIDNMPDQDVFENMKHAAQGMEMVRKILGSPISVSSWYRGPKLNRAVGGATKSAHMFGFAVDFRCNEFGDPFEVAKRLSEYKEYLKYDQLIHEYGRWVHISFDPKQRMQDLSIFIAGNYLMGIVKS